MAHRKVSDVMTTEVITAALDTPFKELATMIGYSGVGALPVLDLQGRVVGVVTELDLLRKQEWQEDPEAKVAPPRTHLAAHTQAAALTAGQVMTSPAPTISPEASIVAAARTMDRRHVRHLVVTTSDGWLDGVVTPSDLLKVYLRPDDELRDQIVLEILGDYLHTNLALVKVTVTEGVATLAGEVEDKSMIDTAVRMSLAVDGVVDVVNRLGCATDDTHSHVPDLTDH